MSFRFLIGLISGGIGGTTLFMMALYSPLHPTVLILALICTVAGLLLLGQEIQKILSKTEVTNE